MSAAAMLIMAGGAAQAAGQIQEGRIAKAQGSMDKKLALRNQESLNRQARAEESASRLDEQQVAKKQKIFQARQLAILGKGGSGYTDATLAALVDTASQFSIERNLTLRRGVFRAGSLREKGELIAAQGRWSKTLGTQKMRLANAKATASLLGASQGSGTGGFDSYISGTA